MMSQQPDDPYAPRPANVPPEVLQAVRQLSQPTPPGGDPYVLVPPPAWDAQPGQAPVHDRALAAIAHAAIIFGFLGIGFLVSLGINLVLWLYSRHSPYVAYHARQAGCYQIFVLVFNVAYLFLVLLLFGFSLAYPRWGFVGTLAGGLTVLGVIWFVGSILLGVVAAVRVLLGGSFAYPVFGRK